MLQENDIQKSVLEKIRIGTVSMHSWIFFVFRAVLIGAISLLAVVGALFVLSFAFFSIHKSGVQFLLEFGEQGLVTFIVLFPWTSLFLFVILLIALEFLVRRYTTAYRFPLVRVFLLILGIGVIGSVLVSVTPLHAYLLSEADNDRLPVLGSFYEGIYDSHTDQGVYRGYVTSITGPIFVISHNDADRDTDEGSWTITPPVGFDLATLSIGDKVYAAGRLTQGIVYAYGVHIVPNGE
ncbi:MAG TPA: hypothetical protein VNF51_02195 [Candidatus Paceibacterota bacterium]|nr:hypothetical protein [Candidatus Paceibacterota bacterium]